VYSLDGGLYYSETGEELKLISGWSRAEAIDAIWNGSCNLAAKSSPQLIT